MVMEDEQHAAGVLRDLKAFGLRLSPDDFGSGYSSLTYMKDLPVDSLKIDKLAVEGLEEDPAADAIVRLIVELAHTLDLEVTAEGVTKEQQARSLVDTGCDLG